MFRVLVWTAVSTERQAEEVSLDVQLETCRKWIREHDATEIGVASVPGHTRDILFLHEAVQEIPAYAEVMERAKRGDFNLLLAYDSSRLARDDALLWQVVGYLGRLGIQVAYTNQYSLVVSPEEFDPNKMLAQRLVTAVLGMTASQDLKTMLSRLQRGKEAHAKAGRFVASRVPYGWERQNGNLIQDEREAFVIRQMFRWYLDEGLSFVAITQRLNDMGVPGPRGGQWHEFTVRSVMENPMVTGRVRWGKSRVAVVPNPVGLGVRKTLRRATPTISDAAYPPIVSAEDYAHFLARRAERRGKRGNPHRKHLLSSILYCANCGRKFHIGYISRGGVPVYVCTGRKYLKTCSMRYIRADMVHAQAEEMLRRILLGEDLDSVAAEVLADNRAAEELSAVEHETAAVQERIRRLQTAYLDGAIPLGDFKTLGEDLNRRLAALTADLERLQRRQDASRRREELVARVRHMLTGDQRLSEIIDFNTLRTIYLEVFERIEHDGERITRVIIRPD